MSDAFVCMSVGKSTFVNAVLGEIPQLAGERKLDGSVAYVPQQVCLSLSLSDCLSLSVLYGRSVSACLIE